MLRAGVEIVLRRVFDGASKNFPAACHSTPEREFRNSLFRLNYVFLAVRNFLKIPFKKILTSLSASGTIAKLTR